MENIGRDKINIKNLGDLEMKKKISVVLAISLALALVVVASANSGSVSVVSDTDTKVYYAGYSSLPADWNMADFDDGAWDSAVLYQHSAYLKPDTTPPFVGTGAKWISYREVQDQLPDYFDPSMNPDGTKNFATYLFRETFEVPATAINLSGTVAVAADNYGWLYLNGDPSIMGPLNESGYNFRPGDQNTGTISPSNLMCDNVLAAKVDNGAVVSGTGDHGPMGLLFSVALDYDFPETTLIAGQNMDVGTVSVWDDGTTLYVVYTVSDPWEITETHLQVTSDFDSIPTTKKNNPIPGQFDYTEDHDPAVATFTYEIPLADLGGTTISIAAHAVVQQFIGNDYHSDLDGFAASLPDQVNMVVAYPGGDSYFNTTVSDGDLAGTYDSFCVDTDHTISPGTSYTADVYSSYEDLPAGTVEFPENLDLVNWIINQDFVGQPSACGGTYTYGDVQRAIWELVEDTNSTSGLGSWSQCRADEITAAALADGEGFTPGCDDIVAVILVPVNGAQITIAQSTFINAGGHCIVTPIYQVETAWGDGLDFLGKNWATYFEVDNYCAMP